MKRKAKNDNTLVSRRAKNVMSLLTELTLNRLFSDKSLFLVFCLLLKRQKMSCREGEKAKDEEIIVEKKEQYDEKGFSSTSTERQKDGRKRSFYKDNIVAAFFDKRLIVLHS